jgi:hypothetical protein
VATDTSLAIAAKSPTRRNVSNRSSLENQFEFRLVPITSIELDSGCSKTITLAAAAA